MEDIVEVPPPLKPIPRSLSHGASWQSRLEVFSEDNLEERKEESGAKVCLAVD